MESLVDTSTTERLVPISHLRRIRNSVAAQIESAHGRYIRSGDLPLLAAHYQGEETGLGIALAMLDGTLRGIESVPVYDTGAGDAVEAYRG